MRNVFDERLCDAGTAPGMILTSCVCKLLIVVNTKLKQQAP